MVKNTFQHHTQEQTDKNTNRNVNYIISLKK